MLFNSTDFLIFFGLFLLAWYTVRSSIRTRNWLIVIASYIFYSWWDYRFVSLLLWSSLVDFFIGLALKRSASSGHRKMLLILSLLSNLGVLFFFKYFGFFRESLRNLLAEFGLNLDWSVYQLVLPVGISFYTFQTLSYTIDVYRRRIEATNDIAQFMAYVAFFPQLIAGPIERAWHFLPQLGRTLRTDINMLESGMWLFVWGLFKKVVVADSLAQFVDPVFGFGEPEASQTTVAAIAFALQIYCDFSGYTDMARGMARILGFDLMQNFDLPYIATNIQEFWRRWHISLGTWLRDYLYVPLRGNRLTRGRTYLNLLIVMLLGGLWHGAAWNFVAWGLWQSIGLIANRWWQETVARRWRMPSVLGWLLTVLFILYGWILFRSTSAEQALQLTASLTVWNPATWIRYQISELILLALPIIAMEIWQWRSNQAEPVMNLPLMARSTLQACLLATIVAFWQPDMLQFIYFQF